MIAVQENIRAKAAKLGIALPEYPALTGTSKQVAWATRLREAAVDAALDAVERGGATQDVVDLMRGALIDMAKAIEAETWIDQGRRPMDAIYNCSRW